LIHSVWGSNKENTFQGKYYQATDWRIIALKRIRLAKWQENQDFFCFFL